MPDSISNSNLESVSVESTSASSHADRRSNVSTHDLALEIARAADDRKGADIVILQVEAVSYLADYFVIVTGFSNVQVRAISRAIEDKLAEEWQRYPVRVEGLAEGSWVLQDYGDLIVHIFQPQEREFYNLEAFWGHAERINFPAYTFGKDSLN